MDNTAVDIQDVEVFYKFEKSNSSTLKEFTLRILSNQVVIEKVHALDGITFQISPGETFGVIGKNGAGKSTLLKLITGIVRPTKGRIRVWGEVRSLLSVGAGFNPELNGRENVFMYSAMLGRSDHQTRLLFDSIVDFSELSQFIDSPLRIYSTGMIARLGFSVAMANLPEILLVDEVLAVGDGAFREKCKKKFVEFRDAGATIIFVSHSMDEVNNLCQRVAWLHDGKLVKIGLPLDVIDSYLEFSKKRIPQIREKV